MDILLVLNESPYGNERSYNGLRTALQLLKDHPGASVSIYLLSDAVGCILKNQRSPATTYNAGALAGEIIEKGGRIKLCKSCLDARGYSDAQLMEGAEISNMKEYSEWIIKADKVITF